MPGYESAPFNVAPVLYDIWLSGDGEAHAGQLGGCGAALVLPFIRHDDPAYDVDAFVDAGYDFSVSTEVFAEWIDALSKSHDEDAADFGRVLHSTFLHMKDHDTDGNYYGDDAEAEAYMAP